MSENETQPHICSKQFDHCNKGPMVQWVKLTGSSERDIRTWKKI